MEPLVQFSFTAGEFAEELRGRSDLERYDMGAKSLKNFAVHYGGGAFKRRGTLHQQFLNAPGRMIPFQFGDKAEDSFMIVFQVNGIFILQNGRFRTLAPRAATAAGATLNIPAHGIGDRAWVYTNIHKDPVVASVVNADQITLEEFNGAGAGTAGVTTVWPLLQLPQPYAREDFHEVKFHQVFDVIRLTHPDYREYELTRSGPSSWSIAQATRSGGQPVAGQVSIGAAATFIKDVVVLTKGNGYNKTSTISMVGGGGTGFLGNVTTDDDGGGILLVSVVEQGKGYTSRPTAVVTNDDGGSGATFRVIMPTRDAGFIVTVSAVFADGSESGPMRPTVARNHIDFTQVRGEAQYSWPPVPGAVKYRVYRSAVYPDGKDIHIGLPLGYLGETRARSFTDNNITPDFSRTPQVYRDPFTPGRIVNAVITNDGSGYADNATLTVVGGGGSGAVIWPVIKAGELIGVYIANHGRGYVNPTVSLGGGGTGAVFSLTISSETETLYPGCSFTFQQRVGYAGSREKPMTVYGSKVNDLDNFSLPSQVAANDPYEYTLDAQRQSRIRHALPAHIGLLLFTGTGINILRGAGDVAIPATGAIAEQQSFFGCSEVAPVFFGNDILYVQDMYQSLRMLSQDSGIRRYADQELSTLAGHFFRGKPLRTFAASPKEKLGVGIYEDGTAFMVTIDKEQGTFGFSHMETRGRYLDACMLIEGTTERLYFIVEREYNGFKNYSIEVMNLENTLWSEEAVYMDSVIRREPLTFAADATWDGTVLRLSANLFTSQFLGRIVSFGGGRGYITGFRNPREVYVTMTSPILERAPQPGRSYFFPAGTWWYRTLTKTMTGLPWNGATVSVVVDGKQQSDKIVTNGAIDLDYEGAIIHVGFRYAAELETLPVTHRRDIYEMKLVTISEARVKVRRGGSFKIGDYTHDVWRADYWRAPSEAYKEPMELTLHNGWEKEGTIKLEDDSGLPLEILTLGLKVHASS